MQDRQTEQSQWGETELEKTVEITEEAGKAKSSSLFKAVYILFYMQ